MRRWIAISLFAVRIAWGALDVDEQFAAALHAEMVSGDVKTAMAQYGAIVARSGANRTVAAKALFQIGQCQEKLGQRDAARAAYARVVSEYSEQAGVVAQSRERIASLTRGVTGPRNLNFERGEPGQVPPGWTAGEGCVAEMRRGGGVLVSRGGASETSGLMQRFPAAAYRGKTIRLRAAVRTADTSEHAVIWMNIERANDAKGFSERSSAGEITGEVEGDAQTIELGIVPPARGRVWVDRVTLEIVPEAEIAAARDAIERIYGRLDRAYARGDFEAIGEMATNDAEYRDTDGKHAFRETLGQWRALAANGTELAYRTALTGVRLNGEGASATVRSEYARSEADGTRSASYIATRLDSWVRRGAAWKLKEYRVLTTRQVDSTTDTQTAKNAAAELKQLGIPIATIETGHTFYDLSPIGTAVGDARIVALGEATFGTREFFQVKNRLIEYLVKEKGFTVFAINANWPEAEALDQYISRGTGNPRELLTRMLWPWNTEEALDVVNWMREFNAAPGAHPLLKFASFGMANGSLVIPRVLEYLRRYSTGDAATVQADYTPLVEMESRLGEVYDDGASKATERAEAVVKLLDAKRDAMAQAGGAAAWRDARQAAEIARQAAAMRVAGRGASYGNEMIARNIEWLARDAYPDAKIVVWGHNALVAANASDPEHSAGAWLREKFGEQFFAAGFAFHRGELLAIGVQNGQSAGVARQTISSSSATTGDAVLSTAGMPVFFLNLHGVPSTTALGRWLAEPHSFLEVGVLWNQDDPESNSRVRILSKTYDSLIFVEEGHAAHGL